MMKKMTGIRSLLSFLRQKIKKCGKSKLNITVILRQIKKN